jgi:hypothetical protein
MPFLAEPRWQRRYIIEDRGCRVIPRPCQAESNSHRLFVNSLERHAQLESEDPHVRGAVVAAGIDNILKVRLNVCPVKDIERVEDFLDKLVGLYAETGTGMAGDVLSLSILYVAGDAVITRCYTARIVWSLGPRPPVVESSERLKILK